MPKVRRPRREELVHHHAGGEFRPDENVDRSAGLHDPRRDSERQTGGQRH